jgi:hypothetical protein
MGKRNLTADHQVQADKKEQISGCASDKAWVADHLLLAKLRDCSPSVALDQVMKIPAMSLQREVTRPASCILAAIFRLPSAYGQLKVPGI